MNYSSNDHTPDDNADSWGMLWNWYSGDADAASYTRSASTSSSAAVPTNANSLDESGATGTFVSASPPVSLVLENYPGNSPTGSFAFVRDRTANANANTNANTNANANANTYPVASVPPNNNGGTAPASPIVPSSSSSSLPYNVASSSSAPNHPFNENDDDDVRFDLLETGVRCAMKEEEDVQEEQEEGIADVEDVHEEPEQGIADVGDAREEPEQGIADDGDVAGVDVREDQETALSHTKTPAETTATIPPPGPILVHGTCPNPKRVQVRHNPPRSCRLRRSKRKAAGAIPSTGIIADEDGGKDYCEEEHKEPSSHADDCSASEVPGPRAKKTRKNPCHRDKTWEDAFQLLLEYKARHGNTLVPGSCDKNPKLANWVHSQRLMRSSKKLSRDRYLRLQRIGFIWSIPWNSMFQQLLEYKSEHGNLLVPQKYDKNPQFGKWVSVQRDRHSKKEVSSKRVLCLESIGFVWSVFNKVPWDRMFQLLVEYKAQHGDTLVSQTHDKYPQLGVWVSKQRHTYAINKLLSERVLKLKSIGFVWDVEGMRWESMFRLLLEYKTRYGNTMVPHPYLENPKLGNWVVSQRTRREKLSDSRTLRLESIGFVWHFQKRMPWEAMFQFLLDYKAQNGNTLVPQNYDEHSQLELWVHQQRNLHSREQLSRDRFLLLESIGFVWRLCDTEPWKSMFKLLLEYKAHHGNTLVPQNYDKNPQLGKWVALQTKLHSKKELPIDCVLQLEYIGFVWQEQGSWESMFQLLQDYKDECGNTLVPARYGKNLQLGKWVRLQRELYSKKELPHDRVLCMESIGFSWSMLKLWDYMFQQLIQYKAEHGNTLVSQKYDKNIKLAKWVATQRVRYRNKILQSDRALRLESIGFVFSVREIAWEERFQLLLKYKSTQNSIIVSQIQNPKLSSWVSIQMRLYANKKLTKTRTLRWESLFL